ncbi:hypothetical protein K439DRAFT_1610709 [Ramaria rubella]|nr:hypothetical protein K439DRAFT_1610709 [Ramaria rubella]
MSIQAPAEGPSAHIPMDSHDSQALEPMGKQGWPIVLSEDDTSSGCWLKTLVLSVQGHVELKKTCTPPEQDDDRGNGSPACLPRTCSGAGNKGMPLSGDVEDPEICVLMKKKGGWAERVPQSSFSILSSSLETWAMYATARMLSEHNHRYSVTGYGVNTGNTTFVNHLEKHPGVWKQYEDLIWGPDSELGKQFQATLDGHVQRGFIKLSFTPERLALVILKMLAACDLSISLVEQEEFCDLIRLLKPEIWAEDIPGRKALAELMMQEYEKERAAMRECLQDLHDNSPDCPWKNQLDD